MGSHRSQIDYIIRENKLHGYGKPRYTFNDTLYALVVRFDGADLGGIYLRLYPGVCRG